MKKLFFTAIALLLTGLVFAQDAEKMSKKEAKGQEYRRSSLAMILMEDPNMDSTIVGAVRFAFANAQAPKKFNDHNLTGYRIFTPAETATKEDLALYDEVNPKKKESLVAGLGKGLLSMATAKEDGSGDVAAYIEEQKRITRELGALSYKYVYENKLPLKAMEKWFNVDVTAKDSMDLALIEERGFTGKRPQQLMELQNAENSLEQLTDYGYDLIGNTFFAVARYRYMTGQEFAEEMSKEADAMTGGLGLADLTSSFNDLTNVFKKDDKHSYVVSVRTYLYQLVWDEETENNVKDNYKNIDAFRNGNYRVKFVGQEKSHASVSRNPKLTLDEYNKYKPASPETEVPASDTTVAPAVDSTTLKLKLDLTNDQIVEIATLRAFDKSIAKLEKKYEAFHVKSPLIVEDDKFYAEIGTYDSVEGKDKYEVLEEVFDEKTQRTKYVRLGVLTVDPKNIWDNDPESPNFQEQGRTLLQGKVKHAYSGCLIRRTKK